MFTMIKRIVDWTGSYKKRFYWGIVWSLLENFFIAFPLMGAAYVLNLMLQDTAGLRSLHTKEALWALLFMVFCVLGRFFFSYLRAVFQESIAYEKTAEERIEIGDILKRVSLGFFDRHKTGEIAGAVTTDLSALELYAMKMTDTVIGAYLQTLAMILCILFFSWKAATVAFVGVLCSAFFQRRLVKDSRANTAVRQKANDSMINASLQFIRGITVIKSYGRTGSAVAKLQKSFSDQRDINIKIENDYMWTNSLYQLSLKLTSVAIAFMVCLQTIHGEISLPIMLMMVIFSFVMFARLETVITASHTLEMMRAALDKLQTIKTANYIDEDSKDIVLNNFDISYQNVSFAYDHKNVIENVSFSLPENSTLAIVGPSGSGKTTLCNLLARFYDVNHGSISIDGHDIREMTCDTLLRYISIVFQHVYLFHDTILNNIRFGRPEAGIEEIKEAAKKAACHEFIENLPNGYNTMLGEGGSTLSGGEKQRLSIARAILKDAPIVILDEATASVDPENEHLIQQAISALVKGKTLIVIAHRLNTIQFADNILVIDQGKLVQQGTHEQLIEEEGIYKDFRKILNKTSNWQLS
ncbi:multidrug ABC transporter ATP-binding protein [Lachnospiraceae bacterium]|nr:multidrug ABC transporter ATP-binding protein [Lachnospiraceae bacterium]